MCACMWVSESVGASASFSAYSCCLVSVSVHICVFSAVFTRLSVLL